MKKRNLAAAAMSGILAAAMLAGIPVYAEGTTEAAEETEITTEAAEAAEETEAEGTGEGGLLESIKEKGKLVVGTASGYPPYEFIDITSANQDIVGIDMELAQAIADKLGVELEIQDMNFTSLISSIPTHKVDMAIAGISITEERKETMDFSEP